MSLIKLLIEHSKAIGCQLTRERITLKGGVEYCESEVNRLIENALKSPQAEQED